jgi:hypothetical protein
MNLLTSVTKAHQMVGPAREPLTAVIVESLVGLLVDGEEDTSRGLRLDHVNAWLSYRNDTRLIERLLLAGLRQGDASADRSSPRWRLAHRCLCRLGGYRRRQWQLSEAESHLGQAIPYWEQAGDLKELGTAEYEQAYIHFLRNELDKSAQLFRNSSEHAFGGCRLGGWLDESLPAFAL